MIRESIAVTVEGESLTEERRDLVMIRTLTVLLAVALLAAIPASALAASSTWTATGSMAFARRNHTATLLNSGKVLIVGYFTTTVAEIYDPGTGTFSPIGSTVDFRGQGSTATLLADGRVLIAGGASPSAEIYDPATGIFSPAGTLAVGQFAHSSTLLADGRVLLTGGRNGTTTLASAEIYDPATGSFSATGSLNASREGHAATLLPSGQVLIAGGSRVFEGGGIGSLNSAELYDPATGGFSATGNMAVDRAGLLWTGAPLLSDGRVLVAGGNISFAAAELFDPATGTFGTTGSMNTPRSSGTATLLSDGQVLITGGSVAVNPLVTTNTAELYDPASETFTSTAIMNEARQEHTATLLSDGQVLVTGGSNGSIDVSSAELFSLAPAPNVIPVPGFSVWALTAIVGAMAVLLVWHLIKRHAMESDPNQQVGATHP